MRKKKAKKIIRKCLVCGKKLTIALQADGTYKNAHYFGDFNVPVKGTGKNKKAGTFMLGGKKYSIVKWTGKEKKVEYWECEKCYSGKSENPKQLLGLKGKIP